MNDTIVADEQSVENAHEDYAARIAELESENARLENDRNNYRKAALVAKGRIEPDEDESPDLDTLIQQKVEAAMFDTKKAVIEQEKESLLQKALRENEELRKAASNRGQVSIASGAGSNMDKPEVRENYWSPEQEAALKAKGLDPQKVMNRLPKTPLPR